MTSLTTNIRGKYNEINYSAIAPRTRKQIENLVNGAAKSEKIDEHGSWEFEADFDKKGRGSALNWDVYGYGKDKHTKRFMAVIQVRQYVKHHKNWYPQIRKSYFLLGRNEDNSFFAHSVESRTIHAAIKKDADVVHAVQSWIFGYDYSKVIRQGDLALIPSKKYQELREAEKVSTHKLIEGSHNLFCDAIAYRHNNLYALNPYLQHIPLTHPDVEEQGWFKVVVGKRTDFYDFAAPTVD